MLNKLIDFTQNAVMSKPSVCASGTKVDCAKTVQDRPMVCTTVEHECGVEISGAPIFDLLGP